MTLNARQRRLLELLRKESRRLAWEITECQARLDALNQTRLKMMRGEIDLQSRNLGAEELREIAGALNDRRLFIESARASGYCLKDIGAALGITKQAVHQSLARLQ